MREEQQVKAAVGDFIRKVSHTAQRELEKAVAKALANGRLKRSDDLQAAITLNSDKLDLNVTIHGRIEL
jgi:hypothetical protein